MKSLIRNMSLALIEYKSIKTTLPKAKELRPFFEKMITKAKKETLSSRRQIISLLGGKESGASEIINIAKSIGTDRSSGYLRIVKCGHRAGDSADMAIIEFVDKLSLGKNNIISNKK